MRPNRRIDLAYPEAFADLSAPTVAELNNTSMVFNITCALTDDSNVGLGDSVTDTSISICSIGNEETPIAFSVEAAFTGFRDEDGDAAGVFNLWRDLVKAPDVPFIIIDRIIGHYSDPYAIGDSVSLYSVSTDYPIDNIADAEMITLTQNFIPDGNVNTNYRVVA